MANAFGRGDGHGQTAALKGADGLALVAPAGFDDHQGRGQGRPAYSSRPGWLECLAEESNADFFAPAIENTAELIVPSIGVYEVFKRVS